MDLDQICLKAANYLLFLASIMEKNYSVIKSFNCIELHRTWTRIILGMCWANERQRYNVTWSLIGWAHTQKIPDE